MANFQPAPPWMQYQRKLGAPINLGSFLGQGPPGMSPFGAPPGMGVVGPQSGMMGGGPHDPMGPMSGEPQGQQTGLGGLEKAALIAQILSAGAGIGGTIYQGVQQDRERKKQQQDRESGANILGPLLQQMLSQRGGG